jgi:hypothetical protein
MKNDQTQLILDILSSKWATKIVKVLGEDTSELFGITVLAKLQLASLRRARLEQSKGRPFYLYVDEFQNFATTSFV